MGNSKKAFSNNCFNYSVFINLSMSNFLSCRKGFVSSTTVTKKVSQSLSLSFD